MKKKLLIGLLAGITALAATFGFAACGEKEGGGNDGKDQTQMGGDHTHAFTQETAESKYLKSAANCTEKAVYFKSCECGAAGEATFEYGQPNGHSFTKEIAEAKYLKSAATSTAKAVYYKSCVCGQAGEDTFEYGELLTENYGSEGVEYTLSSDGKYYIAKGTGAATATEIVVGNVHKNLPVKAIEEGAFFTYDHITSITIAEGIVSIGDYAFMGCSGLTSVTIPQSVTSIGKEAFDGCNGVASITVTGGNEKYLGTNNCLIEKETKTLIYGCKTSVIPADGSVTKIGNGAFEDCSGLTSIVIPSTVTGIGDKAFKDCSGLTSVTVANGVLSVGESAFSGCEKLTGIAIPDSVTSIAQGAFYNCGAVQTEGGVKYADKWVISCDMNADSVSLRSDTVGIADCAFNSCGDLLSITLPSTVKHIGYEAFSWCISLTSISMGIGVTDIGDYAFDSCIELTSIEFNGTKAQWTVIAKGEGWDVDTGNYTVHCTDGTPNKE